MKNSSTRILPTTMTVLARADWRTPAISTPAIASTSINAGTFTSPPSPGGSVIESERVTPKTESSSSTK